MLSRAALRMKGCDKEKKNTGEVGKMKHAASAIPHFREIRFKFATFFRQQLSHWDLDSTRMLMINVVSWLQLMMPLEMLS